MLKDKKARLYLSNLVNQTLKMAKQDSAFLYFVLESNEGLCFYSTLPLSDASSEISPDSGNGKSYPYRLVKIHYAACFSQQIKDLISHSQKSIEIELL